MASTPPVPNSFAPTSGPLIPAVPVVPSDWWGFKVMLIGDTGGGKTFSIVTLALAGLEVFVIFTENGMAAVRKAMEVLVPDPGKRSQVETRIHWHYIKAAPFDLNAQISMASNMSKLQFQGITQMVDNNKSKYGQIIDVLTAMQDFKDDRTGAKYGPVEKWGPEKVLVIDSLSGLSLMAMHLVIGGKPGTHEGEWGIAMGQIEKLINAMCLSVPTNFVLMSHIERETSAIDLAPRLMASTLGKKLAPKLPRYFDEVIVAYREVDKFFWSTLYPNAETKTRVLGIRHGMQPSFEPIVKAFVPKPQPGGQ